MDGKAQHGCARPAWHARAAQPARPLPHATQAAIPATQRRSLTPPLLSTPLPGMEDALAGAAALAAAGAAAFELLSSQLPAAGADALAGTPAGLTSAQRAELAAEKALAKAEREQERAARVRLLQAGGTTAGRRALPPAPAAALPQPAGLLLPTRPCAGRGGACAVADTRARLPGRRPSAPPRLLRRQRTRRGGTRRRRPRRPSGLPSKGRPGMPGMQQSQPLACGGAACCVQRFGRRQGRAGHRPAVIAQALTSGDRRPAMPAGRQRKPASRRRRRRSGRPSG
jgi:hypothetical protein